MLPNLFTTKTGGEIVLCSAGARRAYVDVFPTIFWWKNVGLEGRDFDRQSALLPVAVHTTRPR